MSRRPGFYGWATHLVRPGTAKTWCNRWVSALMPSCVADSVRKFEGAGTGACKGCRNGYEARDALGGAASGGRSVATSGTTGRSRATSARPLGDDVGGERRARAGVAGDDQDRVLPQRVPNVRGKAARLVDDRSAPGRVVLRPVDVERKAGLALAEEHTPRRSDRVADEVARRGRHDRSASLLGVDLPAKRRTTKPLALAEADKDPDLAGGDGPTERHVLTVARSKAASKGWQTSRYLLIWFVVDHGVRKARLTMEGAGLDLPPGWSWGLDRRMQTTVPIERLADELARVGRLLEGH